MKKAIICSWILIDAQNRILLIKRKFNEKNLPHYWIIPWWNQEDWESNEETTMREVKEEIWLNFKIRELFMEGEWINGNYFYRYLWIYSWKIVIQEEECDGYWWFSLKETENLLVHQNIKDLFKKLSEANLLK